MGSPARATISRRNSGAALSRGFTLIEILIVLAIISMVISVGLPAVQRVTYQRINSTTRKFIGLVRTIKNDAILLNTIHRLVIDMDHQTWWVEGQKKFELLSESDIDQSRPQAKKKGKAAVTSDPTPNFAPVTKFAKRPVPLPDGVAFAGVYKEREGLIRQGLAYINFFPNGYNDQAIVYLVRAGSDPQHFDGYSLVLRPISGQVDVVRRYVQRFD